MEREIARGNDDRRDDRLHLTVKVEGAVLPPYFIVVLLAFCVFVSSSCLFLWMETRRLSTELWLLKDYTEGRIDHLPYRPEPEPEIRIERSE